MTSSATRDPLRFLVVIAHPHDFTHCAGTCGIHIQKGDAVTIVVMTDGGRKHNEAYMDELMKPEADRDPSVMNQTPEGYAEQKATEIQRVCALFGVTDLRILTFSEPFRLARSPEAVEALEEIIRDVRPQVMITHAPFNTSPCGITRNGMGTGVINDHRETAIAALEARVRPASTPDYENQKQAHIIAATYYLGVDVMPDQVDFYVDISRWREQRFQAETLFASQGQDEAFARVRVETGAGSAGWNARTQYAEGFVRAQIETLSCIEVTEWDIIHATVPSKELIRHRSGELMLTPEI
jgi:LmbE family N-acetylglucosaminyl deacetylase